MVPLKKHTQFQTKTAQTPYPLGQHMPIQLQGSKPTGIIFYQKRRRRRLHFPLGHPVFIMIRENFSKSSQAKKRVSSEFRGTLLLN